MYSKLLDFKDGVSLIIFLELKESVYRENESNKKLIKVSKIDRFFENNITIIYITNFVKIRANIQHIINNCKSAV